EPEPAKPSPQIGRVDRVKPRLGVDVDDPLTNVEPVVVLLVLFVLVERLSVTERPLTFTAGAAGRALSRSRGHRNSCPSVLRAGGVNRGRADDPHEIPGSRHAPGLQLRAESASRKTDRAVDPQQIDMPAR